MTEQVIQRGALRMTIKGATPMLVAKGNALIVTGTSTAPIKQAVTPVRRLRLVQQSA